MTVKEVKKKLIEKGIDNISEMARILIDEKLVTSTNVDSVRTMLTALLYGKSFYPSLADAVNNRFQIKITRPAHCQTVRQAIKQVA